MPQSQGFTVPQRIAELLSDLPSLWAFCGGWAIDLFIGEVTREHEDVEIAISRTEQHRLRSYLDERGWVYRFSEMGHFGPPEVVRFLPAGALLLA